MMLKKQYKESLKLFDDYKNGAESTISPEEASILAKVYCYRAKCTFLMIKTQSIGSSNIVFEELQKALKFYQQKKALPDDMFQYQILVLLVMYSLELHDKKYFKKFFPKLLEPRPNYEGIIGGLRLSESKEQVIKYVNTVNRFWNKLSYSENKERKKKWRLCKNSTLVMNHVRNAMARASI